jgi:hypothetical protein
MIEQRSQVCLASAYGLGALFPMRLRGFAPANPGERGISENVLGTAPPKASCGTEGRGFESLRARRRATSTTTDKAIAGEDIPIGASVISVCDAFDAMTSTRPYSEAIPVPDALAELRRCSGTQFDPDVVKAFCELIEHPGHAIAQPA